MRRSILFALKAPLHHGGRTYPQAALEVELITLSGPHLPRPLEDQRRKLLSGTDYGRALVGSDSANELSQCLRLRNRGVVLHGRRADAVHLRVERRILGHLDDPSLNRMPENAVACLTDPTGGVRHAPVARAMNNFGHVFMRGDLADRPLADPGVSVFLQTSFDLVEIVF